MKERHLKYIAVTALITVGLLQLIWILHTYHLQKRDIKVKTDELFFEAVEGELYPRVDDIIKNAAEGDTLMVGTYLGSGLREADLIAFQELCLKYNSDISLFNIDSIFNVLLIENNLFMRASLQFIQMDSLEAACLQNRESGLFEMIKTNPIPIREDRTLYIQATLHNPFTTIITRILLLLFASVVMITFVVYCIILQIRVIIRQNRIARLRQDFSHAMIHDMKTPLTSIMVGTRMLESGKLDENPDKKSACVQIMKDEINHLLALTNKILTLAKMEGGRVTLEKQVIEIEPMINGLMEKFAVKKSKDIKFITSFTKESVYADAEYLKEAISNLIDNAIKYSGSQVIIEITCEEKEGGCVIKVKDNGFGISLKDQSLIFEKFERAAATKRSSKGGATGFGLGLNYVQQVVAAHGGTVTIESIEGKYSEFTISIPQLIEKLE